MEHLQKPPKYQLQMKNLSPIHFFLCAFGPFAAGALVHEFSQSDLLAWVVTVSSLVYSFYYLYSRLGFNPQARKTFRFFALLSLFLSLSGSYFCLILEGLESFAAVREFQAPVDGSSDLIGMAQVGVMFKNIAEEKGLREAIMFPWIEGYYNNMLSPLKWGFALWSLPGIGYYSWTILSWWFCTIFFALALKFYQQSSVYAQQKNYFCAGLVTWMILPFALPIDREAIAAVLVGVIALGVSSQKQLSILDWFSIALSTLLLSLHRMVYLILPFVLFPYFLWSIIRPKFFKASFQKVSKKSLIYAVMSLLVISAFVLPIFANVLSFLYVYERIVGQIASFQGQQQDLWNQFRLGIPVIDDFVKLLFLLLTPFPYYQMFKAGDGWALIVPPVLISLNVFPVFMVGKLILIVLVVRKFLYTTVYSSKLFYLCLLFLLPVLASIRTGPLYLIPSFSFLVLWLLQNGLNSHSFKEGLKTTLIVAIFAHMAYIIVYGKL